MNIIFANATDQGLKRDQNQDALGKFPEDHLSLATLKGQFFIVADGMGGHAAGEEASNMAVAITRDVYFSDPSQDIAGSLQRAMEIANGRINARAQGNPELGKMGTTCTILVLQGECGYIAHVGDSRVYRLTPARIEQLTLDHTKVAEMQRFGILTAEQARNHPEKSYLNRALGLDPVVAVDMLAAFRLQNNEHYVLCTDGLGAIEEQEMKKIVLSHSPAQACRELITLANQRGGSDNATVQVIRVVLD